MASQIIGIRVLVAEGLTLAPPGLASAIVGEGKGDTRNGCTYRHD
jgi:hypothetical protein